MHTAEQLSIEHFAVEVDGHQCSVDDLLPSWHKHQRFGIVVHEPLGGVGASLLTQAFVAKFHASILETWDEAALASLPGPPQSGTYPEIYAFHVGRGLGDLGAYDFWPPHKETLVEANPMSVVQAINDRGITILAVPEGDGRQPELMWPERRTFLWRTEAVFSYSASGRVREGDVTIRALDPATEENPTSTLHPEANLQLRSAADLLQTDAAFAESMRADGLAEDYDRFRGYLTMRQYEVSGEERGVAIAARRAILADGLATETYHRRDSSFALQRLVP